MQLFLNATSPFARLARVVALEKGWAARLDLLWCDPWNDDPALLAVHPQGRIPVLVTDDGQAISECLLIAQYLEHLVPEPALLPTPSSAHVLARTSVAYGLMEAAFQTVIARKHEGAAADAGVMQQRRLAAIARDLQQLQQQCHADHPASPTLDYYACAIALAYVVFRLPELLTPDSHPQLWQWLQQAEQRPSLQATAFA